LSSIKEAQKSLKQMIKSQFLAKGKCLRLKLQEQNHPFLSEKRNIRNIEFQFLGQENPEMKSLHFNQKRGYRMP